MPFFGGIYQALFVNNSYSKRHKYLYFQLLNVALQRSVIFSNAQSLVSLTIERS